MPIGSPEPTNPDESATADDVSTEQRPLPPARIRTRIAPKPVEPELTPAAPEDPTKVTAPPPAQGRRPPPVHTRFKPGQSGNPKGRPKGSRSLSTLVDEALSQQVAARMNGRVKRISVRDALVRRLVEQAMRGDLKAFTTLVKLDPRARSSEAGEHEGRSAVATPEEEALLLAFLKRTDAEEDGQ